MARQYTAEELNSLSAKDLSLIVLSQQEQINSLNTSFEKLLEQVRIANQYRFGRRSEKMDVIDGQLTLFDEADAFSDPEAEEPVMEEVVQSYKRKKQKGKRDADLKDFPVEPHLHPVTEEEAADCRAHLELMRNRVFSRQTVWNRIRFKYLKALI